MLRTLLTPANSPSMEAPISPVVEVRGLPFLGIFLALRRDPLALFSRLLQQRGDRVHFRVLGRKILLLCHPKDLEQILVRDRERYGRSAEVLALRSLFGQGLLASDGELRKQQRTMIQPSFQHNAMKLYTSIMLQGISSQIAQWQVGELLDIHVRMMQYTREVICAVLFGSALTVSRREIGDAVSVVFGDLRAEILYLSLWRRLPFSRNRRWDRAANLLHRSIQQAIEARRASGDTGEDLLGDLLRARDADGKAMSDQQLLDEILTFFLAGHETAALSLTWSAYLLARNQQAQDKAHKEVVNVTAGEDLRPEHYPRLRYVTAVVKEALRLYPPVWSLGRTALHPGVLGSHPVREKTDLWLCLYQLHRDRRWYSDPDRFQPERWLTGDAQPPFTYLPFGVGPRICIGQHFAMAEAVLGLAAILRQFRLSSASNDPVTLSPWITLRPKQRIHLRLEEVGSKEMR